MSDEELSDAPVGPAPNEIVEVKSPEELAKLIYEAIKALAPSVPSEREEASLQFLAGSLSALQMQNMQLLGFIEYIQTWCGDLAKNISAPAPWDFNVWMGLNACPDAKSAREYLESVNKERRSRERHIKLLSDA